VCTEGGEKDEVSGVLVTRLFNDICIDDIHSARGREVLLLSM